MFTINLFISVIIPTYNCNSCLDECLVSVLNQMDEEMELIVVDDGSTDGTVEKLALHKDKFKDKFNNLRIEFCEHKGASGARNTGLDWASGKYVTFVDCDDCIRQGFFKESREMLKTDRDLYIFGIERVYMNGKSEYWTVNDKVYSDVSDFADDFVRKTKLMLYSNCNKFYKRSIIEKIALRFDENEIFGEDRLFNFHYIMNINSVITSSKIMLRYVQRYAESMSTKHIPNFFDQIMMLHNAKIKSLFGLSKGTTAEEKRSYAAYDLCREIENTIERFPVHPQEIEENLPEINKIVFAGSEPENGMWYSIPEIRKAALDRLQNIYVYTNGG